MLKSISYQISVIVVCRNGFDSFLGSINSVRRNIGFAKSEIIAVNVNDWNGERQKFEGLLGSGCYSGIRAFEFNDVLEKVTPYSKGVSISKYRNILLMDDDMVIVTHNFGEKVIHSILQNKIVNLSVNGGEHDPARSFVDCPSGAYAMSRVFWNYDYKTTIEYSKQGIKTFVDPHVCFSRIV